MIISSPIREVLSRLPGLPQMWRQEAQRRGIPTFAKILLTTPESPIEGIQASIILKQSKYNPNLAAVHYDSQLLGPDGQTLARNWYSWLLPSNGKAIELWTAAKKLLRATNPQRPTSKQAERPIPTEQLNALSQLRLKLSNLSVDLEDPLRGVLLINQALQQGLLSIVEGNSAYYGAPGGLALVSAEALLAAEVLESPSHFQLLASCPQAQYLFTSQFQEASGQWFGNDNPQGLAMVYLSRTQTNTKGRRAHKILKAGISQQGKLIPLRTSNDCPKWCYPLYFRWKLRPALSIVEQLST